jgi:hypothetical protein
MEVVRSGPQYWQDPHVWGDPLTLGWAKHPIQPTATQETALSLSPGTGKAYCKISFSTVSLGSQTFTAVNVNSLKGVLELASILKEHQEVLVLY